MVRWGGESGTSGSAVSPITQQIMVGGHANGPDVRADLVNIAEFVRP